MAKFKVFSEESNKSPLARFWRKFKNNHPALVGLWVFLAFALLAASAPFLAPYGVNQQHSDALLIPPSWREMGDVRFILGTDDLGRDVLSRLMNGATYTFGLSVVAALLTTIIGVLVGTFAGISRGMRSSFLNHLLDITLSIPSLLLAIIIIAVLGPGLMNTVWAIILALLIPTILLGKLIFSDPKERAIFSIAGFVGNTGNIGIPLGIALFGEASVIYTTLINIANVFVVYIIGVYIYSRGSFSIKDSLFNIVKIPIIPASFVAILINIYDVPLSSEIQEFLKMGAYAGIVLQLFLLGTFLQGIRIKELHPKLFIGTISQKFVFIPLATALILSFTDLALFIQGVILMEMMVPLAVANINLASLYNCKPRDVTSLILISTILFLPILALLSWVVNSSLLEHFSG